MSDTAGLAESREGMVTVYDSKGRYLGCMGTERWERLLVEDAGLNETSWSYNPNQPDRGWQPAVPLPEPRLWRLWRFLRLMP